MKKRCVDDYLHDLVQPGFKWDEIGVIILCRMFHLHLRILMENTFWILAIDNDLNTCKIFIAVTAKPAFSDTKGVDEVPLPRPKSPTLPPPPSPKVNRRQTRTSQNAGWFLDKELFDPHYKKVQPTPPPIPSISPTLKAPQA